MNALLLWAGQNTIAAFLLAVLVFVVTRAWRHPPVVHLLWLLVLLKLVAPPIVPVSWPGAAPPAAAHFDQASSVVADSSNNNINDTGSEFVADEIVVHEPAVPMHACDTNCGGEAARHRRSGRDMVTRRSASDRRAVAWRRGRLWACRGAEDHAIRAALARYAPRLAAH